VELEKSIVDQTRRQTTEPRPAHPSGPPPAGVKSLTRRNFIVWTLAGLLGAIVAAVTAPVLVYLYPAKAGATAATRIRIPLGTPVDGIEEGGAVQFDAPANTALVMADGGGVNAAGNYTYGGYLTRAGGRLHALAITCPHLGCSYGLDTGGKRFLCPCHGSIFNLEGQVLHGPAANPLSRLTWQRGDHADVILVDGVNQPA
jgi:Rieske Fe-S protein